jgi:hypothetical protein
MGKEVDWDQLLIDQDLVFAQELARLQVTIDRHRASMEHAQEIYDRVEVLKNINFDMIQHNNDYYRELVSEFRHGELHGGSTPAWSESASPGPTGDYLRGGEDSLHSVHNRRWSGNRIDRPESASGYGATAEFERNFPGYSNRPERYQEGRDGSSDSRNAGHDGPQADGNDAERSATAEA